MYLNGIVRVLKLSGNDKLFPVFMVLAIRDDEVHIVMRRIVKLESSRLKSLKSSKQCF